MMTEVYCALQALNFEWKIHPSQYRVMARWIPDTTSGSVLQMRAMKIGLQLYKVSGQWTGRVAGGVGCWGLGVGSEGWGYRERKRERGGERGGVERWSRARN